MPPRVERSGFARALVAEFLGSAFLLAAVVGSGIMAERLASGNSAVALLANSFATAGALLALITIFADFSGAHFNPMVSLVMAWRGDMPRRSVLLYVAAQMLGALAGVLAAHGMFELPAVAFSTHARTGLAQVFSETVATFGLVTVVWIGSLRKPGAVPGLVAGYVGAAYWFTSSTSFANPAVTLARALTNTFSGIRPEDVPGFLAGQVVGALAAALVCRWLVPSHRQ